jgi:hypothetical protein
LQIARGAAEPVALRPAQGQAERPHARPYAAQETTETGTEGDKGGSMKALTRKEAQKQLEFLMAMEKLARVLDRKVKQPAKAQKAKAAAA